MVTVEETIMTTRKAIKRYRTARSVVSIPSLPDSPAHFQQQHPTIFDRIYNGASGPVSCPYSSMDLARVGGNVPVRISKNMLAQTISRSVLAPQSAIVQHASQVPNMMQMMAQMQAQMQQQMQQQIQQHVQQLQQQVQQQQEPKITIFKKDGVAAGDAQQGGVGGIDAQNGGTDAIVAQGAAQHDANHEPLLGPLHPDVLASSAPRVAAKAARESPHDAAMRLRNELLGPDTAKTRKPRAMKVMKVAVKKAAAVKKPPAVKKPTAATKKAAAAAKKPAARKGQMVSNETSRSQVKAWTGKLGPGQYAIFKYKTAKEQVAAVAAARGWLASH